MVMAPLNTPEEPEVAASEVLVEVNPIGSASVELRLLEEEERTVRETFDLLAHSEWEETVTEVQDPLSMCQVEEDGMEEEPDISVEEEEGRVTVALAQMFMPSVSFLEELPVPHAPVEPYSWILKE